MLMISVRSTVKLSLSTPQSMHANPPLVPLISESCTVNGGGRHREPCRTRNEFLMTRPDALTVTSHLMTLLSITVFATVMLHDPVYGVLAERARRGRRQLLQQTFPALSQMQVLDLGGTAESCWNAHPFAHCTSIWSTPPTTLVNCRHGSPARSATRAWMTACSAVVSISCTRIR